MPVYSIDNRIKVTVKWRKRLEKVVPNIERQIKTGAGIFSDTTDKYENPEKFSFVISLNRKKGIDIKDNKTRFLKMIRRFKGRNKETIPQEEFKHDIGLYIAGCLEKLKLEQKFDSRNLF